MVHQALCVAGMTRGCRREGGGGREWSGRWPAPTPRCAASPGRHQHAPAPLGAGHSVGMMHRGPGREGHLGSWHLPSLAGWGSARRDVVRGQRRRRSQISLKEAVHDGAGAVGDWLDEWVSWTGVGRSGVWTTCTPGSLASLRVCCAAPPSQWSHKASECRTWRRGAEAGLVEGTPFHDGAVWGAACSGHCSPPLAGRGTAWG